MKDCQIETCPVRILAEAASEACEHIGRLLPEKAAGHLFNARREMLLALRGLVDHMIEAGDRRRERWTKQGPEKIEVQ